MSRNARQASRFLDEMVSRLEQNIDEGIPLSDVSHKAATGRLFLQTQAIPIDVPMSLPSSKVDNQILAVVLYLGKQQPKRQVILVSKDINMRIKARALGLPAEDYFNDKVLEDTDLLYTGCANCRPISGTSTPRAWSPGRKNGHTYYQGDRAAGAASCTSMNLSARKAPRRSTAGAQHDAAAPPNSKPSAITATARTTCGASPRATASRTSPSILLMDPDIDFVTLLGQAGTGKTLLTLAAGLGAGPGNEDLLGDHHDPGHGAGGRGHRLPAGHRGGKDDALDGCAGRQPGCAEQERRRSRRLGSGRDPGPDPSRIKIKSLNFMRGRTFINKFLIIDEAQNLTPKQMKTLITRAGPGTKVVCLGNISQIDTPYLTEGSSGLTYVVDRFKGWSHGGHVTLARGERSRLADYAAEVL